METHIQQVIVVQPIPYKIHKDATVSSLLILILVIQALVQTYKVHAVLSLGSMETHIQQVIIVQPILYKIHKDATVSLLLILILVIQALVQTYKVHAVLSLG